jgi:hypothetical protein
VIPAGLQPLQTEPGPKSGERSGKRVASLGDGDLRPQKLGQAIAPVRPRIDRDVHQEGQVLTCAESDRLAAGGEQSRLTQATQIPLRLHEGLGLNGVSR